MFSTVHQIYSIYSCNKYLLGTYFLLQPLSLQNPFSLYWPDGSFKKQIRLFLALVPEGFPLHWVWNLNSSRACDGLTLNDLWSYFISLFSSESLSSSFTFLSTPSFHTKHIPAKVPLPLPVSWLEFSLSALKKVDSFPDSPQLKYQPTLSLASV